MHNENYNSLFLKYTLFFNIMLFSGLTQVRCFDKKGQENSVQKKCHEK